MEIVLSLVGSDSVGFGGSVTVTELGIYDALKNNGNPVFFHWDAAPQERAQVTLDASRADWYICSANAITRDAKIINIDGTGNRVASMVFGPQRTILVIGKNKFAENLEEGMLRVKKHACVENARRLNRVTPCAVTGKCADCYSDQRICSVTSIIEAKPGALKEMHLVLVDEELGY